MQAISAAQWSIVAVLGENLLEVLEDLLYVWESFWGS
jgi:hypothetical protein